MIETMFTLLHIFKQSIYDHLKPELVYIGMQHLYL